MHDALSGFIADCETVVAKTQGAADRVTAIAPLMQRLAGQAGDFLAEENFRREPEHYARNAIHIAPSGKLSLFALVWLPRQWTPVPDPSRWGVVGLGRGGLEQRRYLS